MRQYGNTKDGRVYCRLSCNHIRIVNMVTLGIEFGKSSVYCRKCDTYSTVMHRDTGWNQRKDEE